MGTGGKQRLSAKRRAFIERVASGDSPTLAQAYRESFDAEGSAAATVHTEASRLARDPQVAPSIEERRRALEARSGAKVSGGKAYVLRRLREVCDAPETPASAVVSALALLAKASGALDDAVDREAKRASATEDQLVAELAARLDAYADPVIDVTPAAPIGPPDVSEEDGDPEVAPGARNG